MKVDGATLPASWSSITLGDFAEVRLGRQRSPDKAYGPHMAPYLRAANVTWKGLDLSDVKEMAFTPSEQETYRLRAGDVLLSEASGSAKEVGKPAIWGDEIEGCCFQNTLIRLRPPEGTAKFLYFQALHLALSGRFVDDVKGVGIHHLGAERLSRIEINVAPLDEQKRVVAAIEQHLTDLDAGVSLLEHALLNLKRYRASVLKAACEGKLVPTEAELARTEGREYEPGAVLLERILKERRERWEAEQLAKMAAKGQVPKDNKWKAKYEEPREMDRSAAPELPSGWADVPLGLLGRDPLNPVQTGPFGAQLHNTEFVESGVPVIAVGNLTGLGFTDDGLYFVTHEKAHQLARYDVEAGDVLFARSGATLGKVAVAPAHVRGWRMTGHILRARLDTDRAEARFVVCALRGCPWVVRQITEGIRGVTRPGFNTTLLENIVIPLPPLAEQLRIIAEVDRLLSVADGTESGIRAQLKRAEALRRAILKRGFEGKLVPQDPSDEPANVMLERLRAEPQQAGVADARPPRRARSRKEAQEESAE